MVTAKDIEKDLADIVADIESENTPNAPNSAQPRVRTMRPSILMKLNSLTESTGLVISKDDQVSISMYDKKCQASNANDETLLSIEREYRMHLNW